MICSEKYFEQLRKLRDVRENFFMYGKIFACLLASFWVCPENFFGTSRKKFLVCSEKIFLVCPDKIFW
jgi:hypothetical protein